MLSNTSQKSLVPQHAAYGWFFASLLGVFPFPHGKACLNAAAVAPSLLEALSSSKSNI